MAAVVYRAPNTAQAVQERQVRLAPVISRMREMTDEAAISADRGRRRMRKAVEAMRRKRKE